MKILSIDLSTNTGWAVFEGEDLKNYGVINLETPALVEPDETYPGSWVLMGLDLGEKISDLVDQFSPDVLVVEETNKSSRFTSRYSQKCLEYCHAFMNYVLYTQHSELPVYYIDTSNWRKILNFPSIREMPEYLEKMPNGKRDYKWQAVILTNKLYGTSFKKKDNDICDAILIGRAWYSLKKR